MEQPGRPE
uniref:Uncharacterized protein n=1 Tax=Arundo donax TaxID=35708 RepID=A0A0A8ZKC0_ARUDO